MVLQLLLGPDQVFDYEMFAIAALYLVDTLGDFVDLLLNVASLPLQADGNLLKLRVTNDDGVVVSGGDSGAELLAFGRLKVPPGGDQNVGGGVETKKLRGRLLGKVIGNHKDRLGTQAQPLGLHGGGNHLKGLAGPDLVSQERIAAVEDVGDGVELVGLERDFGVDAREDDVAAVILPWADVVHLLVIHVHQRPPPLRVPENPVLECLPDGLLLLGGQCGRLGV